MDKIKKNENERGKSVPGKSEKTGYSPKHSGKVFEKNTGKNAEKNIGKHPGKNAVKETEKKTGSFFRMPEEGSYGKSKPIEKKKQDKPKRDKADSNQGKAKLTNSYKGNASRPAIKNASACPVAKKCGGCTYQGITYAAQLKEKQKLVNDLLKGICPVHPIIGMKNPEHYRNKVHAVFGRTKNGEIISGVYEKNSHRIVPVDSCMIEDEISDAIIRDIRGLLKSFKIKTYDEDTGYGLLRHVLIRRGFTSGQVLVVLVLASPILPSKNNFVKAIRDLHPEITSIVLNVNDKRTSMVLGEREIVLYGKGYIEDTLCGKVFRISPKSFYQVNPVQTEILYQKAIELAQLTGKEKVIDAYCGIGTIGITASDKAGQVIGVELNPDAVKDAVVNAKRNEIKNISFYQNDAGRFMVSMAEQGVKADVVFMDPPRSGSDEAFLSSVVKLSPERIVYISCGPDTLARDLKYLVKHGYKAEEAWPVDMFPWTEHVESVVLLSRKYTG